MFFTNLEKTDRYSFRSMAKLVLTRHIYGERFSQRIAPNARTFVNVVQHLPDFGHFEMNKRDLGRQREDPILVAEELATNNYLASCKQWRLVTR
jgi:hypothetical protein